MFFTVFYFSAPRKFNFNFIAKYKNFTLEEVTVTFLGFGIITNCVLTTYLQHVMTSNDTIPTIIKKSISTQPDIYMVNFDSNEFMIS